MRHGHLKPIEPEECLELLAVRTVGLLAFVNDDGQQLVPINYIVHDGDIIFRTTEDSMLAPLASGHADVAFATTHLAELEQLGWNVTARGTTSAFSPDEFKGAPPRAWAGGLRDTFVRLHIENLDGRRVYLR